LSTQPVLVAPDSFKGTFPAAAVAAAIASGLRAGGREAIELPIGDGGEGTMDALGGVEHTVTASDPLGRPVEARFRLSEDGRARFDAARLRGVIDAVFVARVTHVVPSQLRPPPDDWRAAYAALAREVGLDPDLSAASASARGFLDPILKGQPVGAWNPAKGAWS
jgi:hypothetical protein